MTKQTLTREHARKEMAKYQFSFLTGSLFRVETVKIADLFDRTHDWDLTQSKTFEENLIQKDSLASQKRIFREIKYRLSALTSSELRLLLSGSFQDEIHVLFLAVCKYYRFTRDFMVERVREKILLFDYQLSDTDFERFVDAKSDSHPELDSLAASTKAKLKQVIFRMLAEANIIESTKTLLITPPTLSETFLNEDVQDDARLLKACLIPEADIQRFVKKYAKG